MWGMGVFRRGWGKRCQLRLESPEPALERRDARLQERPRFPEVVIAELAPARAIARERAHVRLDVHRNDLCQQSEAIAAKEHTRHIQRIKGEAETRGTHSCFTPGAWVCPEGRPMMSSYSLTLSESGTTPKCPGRRR